MLQDDLAKQYNYKKLPDDISKAAIEEYTRTIPEGFNLSGDDKAVLVTKNGAIVSAGYKRIVIGDYGAFIEFDDNMANAPCYSIQKGQEYRVNGPKYCNNVKYNWLTINDGSNIKIYQQKKTVSYADYKAGMYYVSPFEVDINLNFNTL